MIFTESALAANVRRNSMKDRINIITIGREYGSGGRQIGLKLAERLGWKFYDKELIGAIAEKTMMPETVVASSDEKPLRRNIFQEIFPVFANDASDQDKYIFDQQGKFIVDLARKGNCIILGRRADYYLRDNPNALHLFFYADPEFRAQRISEEENCTPEEAKESMVKMDKRRKISYEYTTNRSWGDMHNYDRMICTSTLGIDAVVDEIACLIRQGG